MSDIKQLLIVEDDEDIQTQLKWGLSKEYNILQAYSREEAIELFSKFRPLVVTLDLGLSATKDDASEGLWCLREILKQDPFTKVIVVTGNSDRQNALESVKMGAYDFYVKPIDIHALRVIIQRAFYLYDIESENRKLHRIIEKNIGFSGIIGQSEQMVRIFETIHKIASTDTTVLITGESGTGKELVARAIHDKSTRAKGPFIPINCGAIPENLLESELFGHEKGAFTGAYSKQKGKFEFAHKGTLFLDEIGEMSIRLQAKLLRFLQGKKIQRVGGRTDIAIDTRILAATNVDLHNAMKEGRFREDLFYRLSVITINVPPLRERGKDIQLLANVLLERYKTALRKPHVRGLSRDAMRLVENYSWPGNVRELENKLQKAVITTDKNMISADDLDIDLDADTNISSGDEDLSHVYYGLPLKEARKKLEIDLISNVIEKNKGNIKKASEELGVSRPTLYDLIDKYKLKINYHSK